ncbi:hypothetical protein HYDPIDRAFT_114600 [Hydnomerulius pinastri MD-312]|uniref:N-acetyltransferase domain-containing protein n=1 Tax=Hydnomerulius pinastri MD-312 TaxID=994086 RepID=A0A0C9VWD3_9AGAM|nr:hypothetical protein HYDPIDRAFT_114600 [Hydnomerulius pinastri MD-312]
MIDKTRTPSPGMPASQADLAGIIGYTLANRTMLSAEIGPFMTLPPFQRTHVTTHAIGLICQYALDLPSQGGLGLRRLQYHTDVANALSQRVAQRTGFQLEAVLKWDRVVPADRESHNGIPLREGDAKPGTLGRHTVVMSLCWEEWEAGVREKLLQQMERRI